MNDITRYEKPFLIMCLIIVHIHENKMFPHLLIAEAFVFRKRTLKLLFVAYHRVWSIILMQAIGLNSMLQ
jgi:hypothetical protein